MRILFVAFCMCICSFGFSQNETKRYTEKEIAVQDKFVEAKKYTLIGRFEKSQEILTELYKEDRTNSAVAMELSKVFGYLEDPYNEHKYAEKAYTNDRDNEYILANYAAICVDQQKFTESLPVLKKLIAKFPSNEEYSDKLATVYLEENNSDEALSIYNALETEIGVTENVSRRKFEIYELLNDKKKAISELRKLSNAFPMEVRFLHNLASYQRKVGNEKEAIEIYKKILAIDINDPQANLVITSSSVGGGDDKNYLRALTPIVENKSIPIDKKILELIPYLDDLNNTYDKDLADALLMLTDKISIIHSKEAKAHSLKADVLYSTGNIKGAVKSFEKTLLLDDRNYMVWEGLLNAYFDLEQYSDLKRVSIEALDLFPNRSSAYVHYGRGHTMVGEYEEAKDLLEEGIMVSGKDVVNKSLIYAELGRMYLLSDDIEKANTNLEKALDLSDSKNGIALELLGDLHSKNGDTKQAMKFWKLAKDSGLHSTLLGKKLNG